mgnify:CR=1 FL=1
MAKGILNISNYSGGLNNKTNSRDIEDNQFQDLDSLSIETPGKLKVMGAAIDYANSITGDRNSEVTLGNGLFQFNADYDIDNTDGTVSNNEMLFINTDVTSDGVRVFKLSNNSYGTKTVPYGNTFSPVVYSAVDGVVRVTPTSFVDTNTPKKLEYVNETYHMGFTYSGGDNDINTAKNNHSIDVTKWVVLDAKPADTSDTKVKVYIGGEQPLGISTYSADIGFNTSGSMDSTQLTVPVSGNGQKLNAGDIIQIETERMKITSVDADVVNVTRGVHGTTAATHNTNLDIFLIWQDSHGEMYQLGYSNTSLNNGSYTSTAIPTESDYRGKFYANFYAGTKDDTTGQFTQNAGQFFSSDDRVVNIFYELVYTDGQRSDLAYAGTVKNTYSLSSNNIQLNAQVWGNIPQEDNVKSIKFYYNETDEADDGDGKRNVKFLLFEVDFRKGLRLSASEDYKAFGLFVHSSHMSQNIYSYPNVGVIGLTGRNIGTQLPIGSITFKDKPETIRAESYVEQDKHVMGMPGTGYKTSTVANRRLYIGNVRYKDAVSEKLKIANDTILKSNLNAFDTFSFENRIDVEINDGDDIIALESLGSKLLEFKRNHLYIINIARDIEFLEATLEYKGCEKDYHVVRGEGFIAWFNKFGFYLYDGKQVRDLLLDKKGQQRLVWSNYYHENNIIGYDPDERTIIITKGKDVENSTEYNTQTVIAFDMKAFALYVRSKGFELEATTNFITNNAGDILWFSKYDSTNIELRKWNTSPSKLNNTVNIDEMALKTKEFTFGKPSVDKKIISVYLSYKNGDGVVLRGFRNDGQEEILATLDGSSESNFKTLHIPIRKAKTEFVDKKAFDKIKGFGLRFSGSDVATDFEINDIQIIFREKSVK